MNTKQLYTAPEADLLVVRFEENIMSPGAWNSAIVAGTIWDDDDDYGLE